MKTTATPFAVPLTLAMLAATLTAQQPTLELPDGRRVAVLDVQSFVDAPAQGPDQMLKSPTGETRPSKTATLPAIAAFVRHFASPLAFGPDDDVQPLGSHHLTILGSRQATADVAAFLQAAKGRRDDLLQIEVKLMQIPANVHRELIRPWFAAEATAADLQRLVITGPIEGLWPALDERHVEVLSAPSLMVRPLHLAQMSTGTHIAYVRDYTIIEANGKPVADPIVDEVIEGVEVQVMAAFGADDKVQLDCLVVANRLAGPLVESKIDLGLPAPLIVQMPRMTTITLQQKGTIPLGSRLLLSAQKADGNWLCALIGVTQAR